MSALLDAALYYAPRTVPVEGKRPTIRDWPNWPATPEAIRSHWQRAPTANVGIRTGGGLVVLDIDPRAGGDDVLSDLEHEHGELPVTVACRTGGGGRHLYYAGPHDLPSFDLGAGVEVKAAGRQVVAPPSVHPTTFAIYEWEPGRGPGEIERAELPAWISAGRQAGREGAAPTVWQAMLRDGIPEGARNGTLASVTGHLLRRWVDVDLVALLVHQVNERSCRPPLPAAEVEDILDSVASCEVRRLTARS